MGTGKKEANRKIRQGKVGDGMGNVKVKGENFYRSGKKVRQLKVLTGGGAQRNAAGEITKAAAYQSRDIPNARVEPNRKWFGNTRVISQDALSAFRTAISERTSDPYNVLLKTNKLPMSLIHDGHETKDGVRQHQAKRTIQMSSFSDTFGSSSQRKRVKLDAGDFASLAGGADEDMETYTERQEQARLLSGQSGEAREGEHEQDDGQITTAIEPIFSKGQSKRIWNEMYKVIDSSDVVIHVLDARDPVGTRCRSVEKYLKEEAPHKHLVFVLNKTDLVPTRVAARWVRILSKEVPTLAMHASITNPFGKGSLIELLRQFAKLHSNRKQISVGMLGYPNVGKSSIINTLKSKKVANVAPIPGETKVWQYITLTRKIYLIDCPGVVPPSQNATPEDLLLRGVVRVENVEHPAQYIAAVLARVKTQHMEKTYGIKGWSSPTDFLELLARKGGRLHHGGEPDVDGVAKMVLNDFMRGKIPWYSPPPTAEDAEAEDKEDLVVGQEATAEEKAEAAEGEGSPDGDSSSSDQDKGEGVEFAGFESD
ncbi:GTPase required for pre-60S ribosomal subunit nuclear export and maturation [Elasticomyces elasticus]|uniref:Nucleolar GTP-binding protein 2 n=1 Tax=Exophiala sideris TaxID=1016849 RepID=A0ABR0J633_9EURO|nr:GTPase required for pre-60S ribosomal subunit nuclear export and maturation [Elasticomyces elasticus]KAK5028256.1 GTPase required for pre-60S ribosomal subunit nuclear export and maturation [Exophiala sideris]KAK5036101.1 GTPase required for pre-60S ribosomal subunit nuclear export and maturation [Exophiala sideris]KAK5057138.1 GTPase required for pre-60S ribosomal subunit nuclear export and maturation [Exophiala sideris]KAK5181545.1 GTPase required for pre-60S ribosomal subunit nuclear expo